MLTELNLASNHIGQKGIQHLSNALQINQVIDLTLFWIDLILSIKVLTVLDLSSNPIQIKGARLLSELILQNNVMTKALFFSEYLFIIDQLSFF